MTDIPQIIFSSFFIHYYSNMINSKWVVLELGTMVLSAASFTNFTSVNVTLKRLQEEVKITVG